MNSELFGGLNEVVHFQSIFWAIFFVGKRFMDGLKMVRYHIVYMLILEFFAKIIYGSIKLTCLNSYFFYTYIRQALLMHEVYMKIKNICPECNVFQQRFRKVSKKFRFREFRELVKIFKSFSVIKSLVKIFLTLSKIYG